MNILGEIKTLFNSGSDRSVNVKKNIFESIVIKGCSIVVSLLLVPLTLGYLSTDLYGLWLTLSSIILWLNFFDVGFTLGLKNKLAEAVAKEQWEEGKKYVSTTYAIITIIFIPLSLIGEILVSHIEWTKLLNIEDKYSEDIITVLHVLIAFFCLQMIANVLSSVVAAFQKVALSSLFPVIGNVLSLFLIYLLTKFTQSSIVLLSFVMSSMPVIVLIIASLILYQSKFKKVCPSWSFIDMNKMKDLMNLGVKFFVIQIQVVILFQSTNFLISYISSPKDVSYYNIAYKYFNIVMMAYYIVLNPLWPAFTDAYSKEDYKWMNSIYKKMEHMYIVSLLCMIIMLFISPFIYRIWLSDNIDIPFKMTCVVFVYMIILTWDSLQVMLINGIGSIKLQSYVTMIGLFVHIPLSLFLGELYGSYGVIYSMIIITCIYSVFFTKQIRMILSRKAYGIWVE
jgi:O-antigen/teichoic acid export membrane protein